MEAGVFALQGSALGLGHSRHSPVFLNQAETFLTSLKVCLSGCLLYLFQEPTDSLEDSLLSSRPEFIIGPEGEEEENPATKHEENPGSCTESMEHAGR